MVENGALIPIIWPCSDIATHGSGLNVAQVAAAHTNNHCFDHVRFHYREKRGKKQCYFETKLWSAVVCRLFTIKTLYKEKECGIEWSDSDSFKKGAGGNWK